MYRNALHKTIIMKWCVSGVQPRGMSPKEMICGVTRGVAQTTTKESLFKELLFFFQTCRCLLPIAMQSIKCVVVGDG